MELMANIEVLLQSDHEFNPQYMMGVVFSNIKAAYELKKDGSEEEADGISLFTSVMVASLYDCKIGDKLITDEMVEEFTTKPLKAYKLGNFAKFTLSILDQIKNDQSHEFMQGFCSAFAADMSIAVRELESEELL